MFQQLKLTFVLILSMSFCFESHAASDICSICKCENSKTKIDCSSRRLTSIPQPIPPNVEILHLRYNNLNQIKPEAFRNLSSLRTLELWGNNLTEIQPETFQYLTNLTQLNLAENDIQAINETTFQNLSSLKTLVLWNNKLHEINVGTFSNLSRLSQLDLAGNDIKEVKAETFQNLLSLRSLYLSLNNITYIQRGTFENLPKLEILRLDDNNITYIQRGTFENLPNLEELYLENNQIQNYEDGAFLFLPSISYIYLSNNKDMMCGCHLPALVNYTKSTFNRIVEVQGKCQTDPGNNQSKIIPIMEYSQCQNYSLFQRNLQCQTCSGFTCKESEVTTCTGDEPVCENKITMNSVTLEFERSCSTYRKCLAALRNNTFTCNKWTSGASCVSCCTGNLCNGKHSIGWTNFFLFHLIYNSTLKKSSESKPSAVNVSRAMEDELSSLTGAYEVEYCGLRGQKEIFSINCLVLDDVTKDEVLKQIFQTFNTSQTLHNLGIHEDKMELIGEMFCKESTTSTSNGTFYWPMTKIGTDVTIPCHANVATRHCSSGEMVHLEMPTNQYGTSPKCSPFTGVWQEPDMSQCYNTEGITQQLKNITIVDIGKENVEEVSTKLSDISKKAVYFKAEDIDLAVDIQEKMLPLISNVSADITLKNILPSINNMIDTPEEILVEAEQSDGTGSRMLDIIEAIPEEIPLEGQQLTALYSNLGIGAIKVEKDTLNGAVYGISFGNNGTEAMTTIQNSNSHLQVKDTANFISLGRSLLTHLKEGEESKWSRMTFFSLRDDKLYRVIQKSRTKAITKIYSNVIAASIPNIRITNLDEPVIISYNLINQIATKPQCVYWDQSPGQDPRWSTKGCITSEYVPGEKVLCSCNHLTSFALQMIEENTKNIHFISNVGCGISFVFLVLTVILHVSFKNLRKLMTSKILVCLCISLAVSNLIFLVGMQEYATTKPAACKAVAALIHYFLMTSLMWMSVEVLHVCLAAVVVSQTVQRSFMIRSSILSWGLPMIIVTFTLAINYTNNYIRIEQTCWLSAGPFYTALVAPMGIILIFNIFIFSIDVWYLMTLETNKTFKLETKRTRILGIVGVFVLFSAAWILAFFSFGETDEVFTLLFAIFNVLQGMFVFFYYCIYTKNTRDVIFSCVHKRKEANTRQNVTSNNSSTNRERTEVELAETGPYIYI